jgi:hypothetical protein
MYNKIFTKILDSSVWLEPNSTRIVWITFLAAMDEEGFVQFASVRNVAHRANVSIDEAKSALDSLEAPDHDSGDPDNDGRRVEKVDGGWVVLNSEKYRSVATREHQKALNRERVRRHRAKGECNGAVMGGNESVTPSEAEAEAKAEHLEADGPSGSPPPKAKKRKTAAKPKINDAEWIEGLKADPAYAGIDVDREHGKMHRWCETNGKTATRRRFVAWLNRIDPPMKPQKGEFSDAF